MNQDGVATWTADGRFQVPDGFATMEHTIDFVQQLTNIPLLKEGPHALEVLVDGSNVHLISVEVKKTETSANDN